jgi:stress-induced morphogen
MQLTVAVRALALCSSAMRPPALHVRMMSANGFTGPREQQITRQLTEAFSPTHLEVLNKSHGRKEDESHFKVVIVSDKFEGKRLVARHQAVNRAVMELDGTLGFHSLEIGATKTPSEWSANNQVPASPRCMGGDGNGMQR